MLRPKKIRLIAVGLIVLFLIPPSVAYATDSGQSPERAAFGDVSGSPRSGHTAITTQQFRTTNPEAELIVLAPNGSAEYINDRWTTYYDIDPVTGRSGSVEYVAAKHISKADCNASVRCTRSVYVRENFTTGNARVVWSRIVPRPGGSAGTTIIHDIDRINRTHIAVADIKDDAVFVYNLEKGIKVWEWSAQRDYGIDSGGEYPKDWTHVNDVEVLSDGTIMASLRNQDSVIFLAPNGSLLSTRTLGADNRHDVLFEQHNPDYISRGEGAESVLVADSHNNRVVEYEYRGGDWNRTWRWRDGQLKWPRDADRLPGGHTLVTDTHGGRVVEVDESGEIVWSVSVGLPYEAERLSTGDESAGGPTARGAGLESRDAVQTESTRSLRRTLFSLLPGKLLNSIRFIYPNFLEWWHAFFFVGIAVDLVVWLGLEYRWSDWRFRLPVARRG